MSCTRCVCVGEREEEGRGGREVKTHVTARTTNAHCSLAPEEWCTRVCDFFFFHKSFCRCVFHRNLFGVPDHLLLFPTTLVTAPSTTCADPQSSSWFGRLAEQSLRHPERTGSLKERLPAASVRIANSRNRHYSRCSVCEYASSRERTTARLSLAAPERVNKFCRQPAKSQHDSVRSEWRCDEFDADVVPFQPRSLLQGLVFGHCPHQRPLPIGRNFVHQAH